MSLGDDKNSKINPNIYMSKVNINGAIRTKYCVFIVTYLKSFNKHKDQF